jgi:hypothetical protein
MISNIRKLLRLQEWIYWGGGGGGWGGGRVHWLRISVSNSFLGFGKEKDSIVRL